MISADVKTNAKQKEIKKLVDVTYCYDINVYKEYPQNLK